LFYLLFVQLGHAEGRGLGEDAGLDSQSLGVLLAEFGEETLLTLDLGLVVEDIGDIIAIVVGETEVGLGEANGVHMVADFFEHLRDGLTTLGRAIVKTEELTDGMVADDFVVHMICWL
jgi:hypothetical protein